MRLNRLVLALTILVGCKAGSVAAQRPAARLISAARSQIVDLNGDSAAALLRVVLDPAFRSSDTERSTALILLGVTELLARRSVRAREDFRLALSVDPDVSVDTLGDLHSDLIITFEAERAQLFRLWLRLPADTFLLADDEGMPVHTSTSRPAWLFVSVTPRGGKQSFRDSVFVAHDAIITWRWDDRSTADGIYDIQLDARDTAGSAATTIRRSVRVERETVDTLSLPIAPPQSAFAPESGRVRLRQPRALIAGLGLGLASIGASRLGPGDDAHGYTAAAVFSFCGLVGFLSGPVVTRPIQPNIDRNRQLREDYSRQYASAVETNARNRASRRVRVTLIEPSQ